MSLEELGTVDCTHVIYVGAIYVLTFKALFTNGRPGPIWKFL